MSGEVPCYSRADLRLIRRFPDHCAYMSPPCSSSLPGPHVFCIHCDRYLACPDVLDSFSCPLGDNHIVIIYLVFVSGGGMCLLSFGLFFPRGSSLTGFYPFCYSYPYCPNIAWQCTFENIGAVGWLHAQLSKHCYMLTYAGC